MDESGSDRAEFDRQLRETVSGRDIAALDWQGTSLGPRDRWPASLSTLVATLLACPTPMFLAWGPELLSFFNDAYRPVLGTRADRAMGMPFATLWGHVWGDIDAMVEQALGGTSIRMVDMPLDLQREGVPEESWWTFSLSPIRDESGRVAGLLHVTTETTERVLGERARDVAASRLRIALSAGVRIGSWDWDVVNDRITADSRFALTYFVDPERAAIGSPLAEFLDRIHPDDVERVRSEIAATIAGEDSFISEYRIVGPDGEVQWVSAQGHAQFDDAGRCVRFPGISFDITANKNVELARQAAGKVSEFRG